MKDSNNFKVIAHRSSFLRLLRVYQFRQLSKVMRYAGLEPCRPFGIPVLRPKRVYQFHQYRSYLLSWWLSATGFNIESYVLIVNPSWYVSFLSDDLANRRHLQPVLRRHRRNYIYILDILSLLPAGDRYADHRWSFSSVWNRIADTSCITSVTWQTLSIWFDSAYLPESSIHESHISGDSQS